MQSALKKLCVFAAVLNGLASSVPAANTLLNLSADAANSTTKLYGGTVAATLNDPFAYNPDNPTSTAPITAWSNAAGFQAKEAEGVDAILSYTLTNGAHTVGAIESIYVDVWGRTGNTGGLLRDDSFDVQFFNGDYVTPVATVTGLGIPTPLAGSTAHLRATVDLPPGTTFDRIRIVGHDTQDATWNYFTLMEVRAFFVETVIENPLTIESGTYEVAGVKHIDTVNYQSIGQTGGTIRFEVGATESDQTHVFGNYTHAGGNIVIGLLAPPVTGTPIPLITYDGSFTGTPALVLESGSRFTLASSSFGSGTADRVTATFGGSAASLIWTGSVDTVWNHDTTANWDNGGFPDKFFNLDAVSFPDGVTRTTLALDSELYPSLVTFANDADTYTLGGSGAISGVASVAHNGIAPVVFINDNSYSGTTTVSKSAGILQLGNGGTTGSLGSGPVALAGELIFNRSDDLTFPNAVAGTNGLLTQQGAGILSLTANHTGTIGYEITSGTLQVGNGGSSGALAANSLATLGTAGSLRFNRATSGPLTVSAAISGAGNLGFTGTGVLGESHYVLTGDSTLFTGPITVDKSRLEINAATDLGGASVATVSNNGSIWVRNALALTTPLVLEGDGWLETAGQLGALRLDTGVNLAGSITLTGKTRIGSYGSTPTISGTIGESGGTQSLELYNGSGTTDSVFTLTGTGSYSGGTTIRGVHAQATAANSLGTGPVVVAAHPTSTARLSRLSLLGVVVSNNITVAAFGSLRSDATAGTTGSLTLDGGTFAMHPLDIGGFSAGSIGFGVGSAFITELDSDFLQADLLTTAGAVSIDPAAALFVTDLGSTPLAIGSKFTLIDYTGGSLTGTFAGLPEGAYLVVGANTCRIAYQDNSKVTLTAAPAVSAFELWANNAGLDGSPGKETGFDNDPEGDGISNGLEWILRGNPLAQDAASLITFTGSNTTGLTLVFARNADTIGEATLTVEWGTDLTTGLANSLVIGTGDVVPAGDNPAIDMDAPTPGQVTVNIPAANAAGGRIFARLKAILP